MAGRRTLMTAVVSLLLLENGGANINKDAVLPVCRSKAKCEAVERPSCLGWTLPYSFTTSQLLHNSTGGQTVAQERLERWRNGVRNVPKCWAMVQSLLCAFYMPRCENAQVDLPSQELCRVTRGPCRVLAAATEQGWPEFLRCEDEATFPTSCKVEVREARFNTTGSCPSPLVPTDSSDNWYPGWEGCGLGCRHSLFPDEDRARFHAFVAVMGVICLACSLFTVLTFVIDWKSANKYPALIIFYLSWCFLMASVGWLAQFSPGVRDDIVCRKDGTLRINEPSSGENLSCVIVFCMVYYSMLAAVLWFALLSYSWYVSFKAFGRLKEAIETKTAYFHMVAWCLPLVLTIIILALGQVDGDHLSGICFVGQVVKRVGFVLVPVGGVLSLAAFFLGRGLAILVRLKMTSGSVINEKANAKIFETIVRMGCFTLLAVLIVATTLACHVYELAHEQEWQTSLRDHVLCASNLTASRRCPYESRPSVAVVQLHVACFFFSDIAMSTWVWTGSTVDNWKRFLRRVFRRPTNEPIKLSKHKMIAKAFAKRKQINNGRFSLSFNSTHDDPLGMKFDLNSAASQEISSTWQAALPKFVTRRGAFMGAGALGLRRNSSASEASHRRNSNESLAAANTSRRHSLDSQISVHLSEHERQAYMTQARQQRRRRQRQRNKRHNRVAPVPSMPALPGSAERRGSDVSQQGQMQLQYFAKVGNPEMERARSRSSRTRKPHPLSVVLKPLHAHIRKGLFGSRDAEIGDESPWAPSTSAAVPRQTGLNNAKPTTVIDVDSDNRDSSSS